MGLILVSAVGIEDAAMKEVFDKVLLNHQRKRDVLIPVLQDMQQEIGYLSPEAMQAAGRHCGVSPVEVYAVATFYAQFRFRPVGRKTVMVCQGTACHVMGGADIFDRVRECLRVKPGETTEDGMFTLETVACIGACALAPAIVIDRQTHGRVDAGKIRDILDGAREN